MGNKITNKNKRRNINKKAKAYFWPAILFRYCKEQDKKKERDHARAGRSRKPAEEKNELLKHYIPVDDCACPLRTGMFVYFEKPIWGSKQGSKRKYTHLGSEAIEGLIANDSYGKDKGQHTFTILELRTLKKHRIKGRHLYPSARVLCNGRKPIVLKNTKAEWEIIDAVVV